MLGKSHQLCSIAVMESIGVGFNLLGPATAGIGLVVGTSIGALVPDIDQKNSKISKKLPIKLNRIFKHRGFTHSLLAWLLYSAVLFLLMNLIYRFDKLGDNWWAHFWTCLYLGLVCGYLLHLIEDSFSQAGIRWLAPFSPYDRVIYNKYGAVLRRPQRFGKHSGKSVPIRHWWGRGYKVGGKFEKVCDWLAIVAITVSTCWYVIGIIMKLM